MSASRSRKKAIEKDENDPSESTGDNETQAEDIECSFILIDELQDMGINASDITKLKDFGISTIGQLFQYSQKRLLSIKGLTEAKLEKMLVAGRKVSADLGGKFITATCWIEKMKQKFFLTTGSKQLDLILGGGIESMSITEVYGEYRTGKSQLCHTLCVTCQLPRSDGGASGKAVFVDTEGSFRASRIAEIATNRYNLEPAQVLENVVCARAHTTDVQMSLIDNLGGLLADPAQGPFRILIIDSLTALFRIDYKGRGELSERQQLLNQHLTGLKKLAEEFNIAVLVINQVMADPGAVTMFGPVVKPIGGHVLAHAANTRVWFKKGRENNRICRVVDSPSQPEAEAMVQLALGGITDVEE